MNGLSESDKEKIFDKIYDGVNKEDFCYLPYTWWIPDSIKIG